VKRDDALCDRLAPAIIAALIPLGAKMPRGDAACIRIGRNITLTLSAAGVTREDDEDIEF
jgi:hypothetical protein